MKRIAWVGVMILAGLSGPGSGPARSDEVRAAVTTALQSVLEEAGPRFEKASGHKLIPVYALGAPLTKRVVDGEATDLVISSRAVVDDLIRAGKITPANSIAIAGSGIGVAVRQGEAKPDISTPEALKRALLAARAIGYSNPAFGGLSGVHFGKVLAQLGIAEAVRAKTRFPPSGGFVADLLVRGEIDLAVQQFGELLAVRGAEVVGPLPGDLQNVTVYVAAPTAAASSPDAAASFVAYLLSGEGQAILRSKGLNPK